MRRLMFVPLSLSFALFLGCGKDGDDKSKPETLDDVVKDVFMYQEELAGVLSGIESDADFDKNKDRIEKILDKMSEVGPRLKVVFKGKSGKEVSEAMMSMADKYPETSDLTRKVRAAALKLPPRSSEEYETMEERSNKRIRDALAEFDKSGTAKTFTDKRGTKTPKYEKTK